MTPQAFRKIMMSLPDAQEGEHQKHADFRVQGKIFASLGAPDDAWGMLKLTKDQLQRFVKIHPQSFVPCKGAWGERGYTNILLAEAPKNLVMEAAALAHENAAAGPVKKLVKKMPAKGKLTKKPPKRAD